jgi:hypothetical protein
VKIHLKEIVFESVDWIHLAQDKVGSCEHNNGPLASIKLGEFD